MGLLEIAYDEQNHLKITTLGEEVLYGRHPLQLAVITREEPKPKEKTKKPKEVLPTLSLGVAPSSDAADEALFQHLRELRRRLADKQGFPPYIIMSDKCLRLIAAVRPTTVEAFGNISGLGEYKQKKYGKTFVEAIAKFAEE